MLGGILITLLIFLGGGAALTFAILAWRLRNDVFFYLGITIVALLLVYVAFNFEYYLWSLQNTTMDFSALIMLVFVGLSTYFLIASKQSPTSTAGDSDVTDAFLDEIINDDDDENIDYT